MAQTNSSTSASTSTSAPAFASTTWLLPWNRKLRNVVSISVRNLSLAPSVQSWNRGKAADDEALPQSFKTPAKRGPGAGALREQKALGHSRSSTDLRVVAENALVDSVLDETVAVERNGSGNGNGNGSPIASTPRDRPKSTGNRSPRRPALLRPRRRSTLDWNNATPQRRQERLEDATRERVADVFFSIHVPGVEEPVYVSETIEQTMNPTFRNVAWRACGPDVTRLDYLALHVWAKGGRANNWRQLLSLNVHLRTLQYLGKSLDSLQRTLPENAVIFHLIDGVYTVFSGVLTDLGPSHPTHAPQSSIASSRKLSTSSFDALLRLSKLDDSIQDALATRNQIADELERLLESNRHAFNERDEVAEAEDRLKTIEFAKKTVEKQLDKARKHQQEKRSSLAARRKFMSSDVTSRKDIMEHMHRVQHSFADMREDRGVKKRAIENQRRRVCEDLQSCYPVEQLPDGKLLNFSIRNLYLPNSEDVDSEPRENIAAALGYVAHSLQMLSFYLSHPLPYPITTRGSTSTIYDGISILKTNHKVTSKNAELVLRTYPLFSTSMPRFRFEYAMFLLNQDIRVLLETCFNLRVLDVRQTLPNLKYLLYVATAGEGVLPARKAGGVRGLMRVPGSSLSRVGSADSTSSRLSGLTLAPNGKGRAPGAVERLREISGKVS